MTKGRRILERVLESAHTVYKLTLSPWLGNRCRFYPACSDYALESFRHHGLLRGGWYSLRRLLRCQPWSAGGFDPVPPGKGNTF